MGHPEGITTDGQGNIWFTEFKDPSTGQYENRIGKLTPGWPPTITYYVLPNPDSGPLNIAADSAGNIWFTEYNGNRIGKLEPSNNRITEYPLPTSGAGPYGIVVQAPGVIWFTEDQGNKIGLLLAGPRPSSIVTPSTITTTSTGGFVSERSYLPTPGPTPAVVTPTSYPSNPVQSGDFWEYPLDPDRHPYGIALDRQGQVWFTEHGNNSVGVLSWPQ
jgi:virginiamycin B lyase